MIRINKNNERKRKKRKVESIKRGRKIRKKGRDLQK
jgi:hypothetical protein